MLREPSGAPDEPTSRRARITCSAGLRQHRLITRADAAIYTPSRPGNTFASQRLDDHVLPRALALGTTCAAPSRAGIRAALQPKVDVRVAVSSAWKRSCAGRIRKGLVSREFIPLARQPIIIASSNGSSTRPARRTGLAAPGAPRMASRQYLRRANFRQKDLLVRRSHALGPPAFPAYLEARSRERVSRTPRKHRELSKS